MICNAKVVTRTKENRKVTAIRTDTSHLSEHYGVVIHVLEVLDSGRGLGADFDVLLKIYTAIIMLLQFYVLRSFFEVLNKALNLYILSCLESSYKAVEKTSLYKLRTSEMGVGDWTTNVC
jgi:hypothetical protein